MDALMHDCGLEGASHVVEQSITNRKQEVTVRLVAARTS